MRIQKIVSSAIAALLVAGSFIPSSPALGADVPSDALDTASLQACLKQEGASLDVMLLMDASSSLYKGDNNVPGTGSDPTKKRLEMIRSALNMLLDLATSRDIDLSASLRTFSKDTDSAELAKHSQPWTNIDSSSDIENIVRKADWAEGQATDWLGGLETAYEELNARQNRDTVSCPVMLWVTDGVINPQPGAGEAEAVAGDIQRLCSRESGYINWFRKNGVLILGGLLQPKKDPAKDRSQIFTAVVEGEGPIPKDTAYFGNQIPSSGGQAFCGKFEDGWVHGKVVKSENPSELAWKFVDLIAGLNGLVALTDDESATSFVVDDSTGHVDVFFQSAKSWSIKDSAGAEICSNSTGDTDVCSIHKNKAGVTTVSIDPRPDFGAYGEWTIDTDASAQKAFGGLEGKYRQLKLLVTPSPSTVDEGDAVRVETKIVATDESAFSSDGYQKPKVSLSAKSLSKPSRSEGWTTDFNITPSLVDKFVTATATLTSVSGRVYTLTQVASIRVDKSGRFAAIHCMDDADICRLQDLGNRESVSVTNFQIDGATADDASTSVLSHFRFEVTGNDDPSRDPNGYEWTLKAGDRVLAQKAAGKDIVSDPAGLQVEKGDDAQILTLELRYPGSSLERNNIEGTLFYQVKAGSGKAAVRELPVVFGTDNAVNYLAILLFSLLVYLVVLAVAYSILTVQYRRGASLIVPDDEYAHVTLDVLLTPAGIFSRGEDGSLVALTAPHYSSLRSEECEARPRTLTINGVTTSISPHKFNPFADYVMLASAPGKHLVSSVGTYAGELRADATSAVRSIQDTFTLTIDSAATVNPVSTSTTTDNSDDPFGFEVVSTTVESLEPNVSEVVGQLTLVIANFGNKTQALKNLVARVQAEIDVQRVLEQVADAREHSFEIATAPKESPSEPKQRKSAKVKGDKGKDKTVSPVVEPDGDDRRWKFGDEFEEESSTEFSDGSTFSFDSISFDDDGGKSNDPWKF